LKAAESSEAELRSAEICALSPIDARPRRSLRRSDWISDRMARDFFSAAEARRRRLCRPAALCATINQSLSFAGRSLGPASRETRRAFAFVFPEPVFDVVRHASVVCAIGVTLGI